MAETGFNSSVKQLVVKRPGFVRTMMEKLASFASVCTSKKSMKLPKAFHKSSKLNRRARFPFFHILFHPLRLKQCSRSAGKAGMQVPTLASVPRDFNISI